jgi:erythromycin esterase
MTPARCFLVVALVLTAFFPVLGAPRRRAAIPPLTSESAARWLDERAIPLDGDLTGIVGDASIVGLGDVTHGSRELYTTKLQILQFLVERMGFDVLTVEGSFPQFERLNAWILGGPGDLAALLVAQPGETSYYFWDVEEFAAVAAWMRQYNLTRSAKPAIEIFGADVHDGSSAAMLVVDYLRTVDAPAADRALSAYVCRSGPTPDCRNNAALVAQELAAKEAEYTLRSSPRKFADALHAAAVVLQSFELSDPQRDPAMAENVAFAREHRSASKRVVYWAHNEHVTKYQSSVDHNIAAGEWLARKFGSGYVAIGSATFAGTFLVPGGVATLPPAGPDAYELFFHFGPPAFIVDLRGDLHPFLAAPHHLRGAGSGADAWDVVVELRRKFDAIVFVDQTTATRPF